MWNPSTSLLLSMSDFDILLDGSVDAERYECRNNIVVCGLGC
jgi:hypothetical protein